MRGSKTASTYFRWTCSIFLGHAFLPIEAGRSINRLSLSWVLLQDSQPDHEVSIGPIRGPPCMANIKLVNRSLFLRLTSMLDCCNNNLTWKKKFAKNYRCILDMQLRKVMYFFFSIWLPCITNKYKILTVSICPLPQAYKSGVQPKQLRPFTSRPCSKTAFTWAVSPLSAALQMLA